MLPRWMSPPYLWSILPALFWCHAPLPPNMCGTDMCMPTAGVHGPRVIRIHCLFLCDICSHSLHLNLLTQFLLLMLKSVFLRLSVPPPKGLTQALWTHPQPKQSFVLLWPISQSWFPYRCLTFTWFLSAHRNGVFSCWIIWSKWIL